MIEDLLIDFDEMGFVPTTLCENPDEYAQDWRKQLLVEIKRLKAENVRLTTKLGQVLLSIDTVKEMNAMCNIEEQVKQAKIDVLNRLKSLSIYDDNYLDGYVFIDDIDKLLEEYENDATRND